MKKVIYLSLFAFFACSKNADQMPAPALECPTIGIGTEHTHHQVFQNILEEYTDAGLPGLAAAIYTPDDGLWLGSAGLANISTNKPMATCNSFFSGSVAKMYTVAAAMTLYEKGELNLNQRISEHLPDALASQLPNGTTATIRQLMDHSAGMPDHDDEKGLNDYIENNHGHLPSAWDQLSYLFDNAPRFAPGTGADYSSAHTLVLSLVMDDIAGRHHSHIITQNIIGRLGLEETYYKNESGYPHPTNLVSGYWGVRSENDDITTESVNYATGSQGDAGIIATAHDYYLFMKGLVNGQIVSPNTLDTMVHNGLLLNDGTHGFGFGLGLFVVAYQNEIVKYGHSGATMGGMSHVYYYPKVDSYVVVLTNTIIENNDALLLDWTGSTLVRSGTDYLMDKMERVILD